MNAPLHEVPIGRRVADPLAGESARGAQGWILGAGDEWRGRGAAAAAAARRPWCDLFHHSLCFFIMTIIIV